MDSKASAYLVPSEQVAKHWREVYWPSIDRGLLLKDVDSELLSGNILEAIIAKRLAVLSFWWEKDIIAISLIRFTQDSVTSMYTMKIYSLETVRDIKPSMFKEMIAGLKRFMLGKRVARVVAEVGNEKWANFLLKLDVGFRETKTLTLEAL